MKWEIFREILEFKKREKGFEYFQIEKKFKRNQRPSPIILNEIFIKTLMMLQ